MAKRSWNPVRNLKAAMSEEDEERASLAFAGDDEDESEDGEDALLARGAIDVARLVAPNTFIASDRHVQVGGEYCRTLYVMALPPQVRDNWLYPLFLWQEVIDVSLFVYPLDTDYVIKRLRNRIAKDEARLAIEEQQGKIRSFDVERRFGDNLAFLEAIENDQTRPFQIAIVITLRAKSLERLDAISEQLERRLTMCTIRRADLRHVKGFLTTLPVLDNHLLDTYAVKNVQTQGVQTMFPFTSSDITHGQGVLLGVNLITKNNVIIDRFMQPTVANPAMAVLGVPGSGKSYAGKTEMLRWNTLHGVPVIVIDPQNEYDRLCAGLGGQFIDVSSDSHDRINPLDFSHSVHPERNALQQKLGFMLGMVEVLLRAGSRERPPLSEFQRSLLDKALRQVYLRCGYQVRSVATQLEATPDNMPLLADVYDTLERMRRSTKDPHVQGQIIPLIVGLQPYVYDGAYAGLFDGPTSVDLSNPFIVFNIQKLENDMLPIGMYMVLEFLRNTLFTHQQQISGQRRLLYVDEAQRLMDFPETAVFLDWVTRTARKFNVGLTLLTQNVEGFLLDGNGADNKTGRAILANCSTTMLMRQGRNSQELLQSVYKLSPAEAQHLGNFATGECLVSVDDARAWVSLVDMTSPLEHEMITTTAREVAAIHARTRRGAEAARLPATTGGENAGGPGA